MSPRRYAPDLKMTQANQIMIEMSKSIGRLEGTVAEFSKNIVTLLEKQDRRIDDVEEKADEANDKINSATNRAVGFGIGAGLGGASLGGVLAKFMGLFH